MAWLTTRLTAGLLLWGMFPCGYSVDPLYLSHSINSLRYVIIGDRAIWTCLPIQHRANRTSTAWSVTPDRIQRAINNGRYSQTWIDVDFRGDLYDRVYRCVHVLIINLGEKNHWFDEWVRDLNLCALHQNKQSRKVKWDQTGSELHILASWSLYRYAWTNN